MKHGYVYFSKKIQHSADILEKTTFFLLSVLENYSKISGYYLNWSFGKWGWIFSV